MAYDHIDNAEVIGGAKYRSTEMSNGYWTDPLVQHNLGGKDFSISVTYMPQGTQLEEDQEEG